MTFGDNAAVASFCFSIDIARSILFVLSVLSEFTESWWICASTSRAYEMMPPSNLPTLVNPRFYRYMKMKMYTFICLENGRCQYGGYMIC